MANAAANNAVQQLNQLNMSQFATNRQGLQSELHKIYQQAPGKKIPMKQTPGAAAPVLTKNQRKLLNQTGIAYNPYLPAQDTSQSHSQIHYGS